MYIERVPNRNSAPTILLRESYREAGKVRKRTLANLTSWPLELVEQFEQLLKGGRTLSALEDTFDVVRSLPHGHVVATLGTLKRLELDKVIAQRPSLNRKLVVAMVVCRILESVSKLATLRQLEADTATHTLSVQLSLATTLSRDSLQRRHLGLVRFFRTSGLG